jgi:hypothetical protein
MPAIIYQKTPGGLFATGERTVSTFPSGLVRVDQTFICPTSDAATHRAALAVGNDMPGDSAPAIDGLKIFPEPQEKKRDNGFTEFIVSAYGRVSTNGTINESRQTVRFGNYFYTWKTIEMIYVIQASEDLIRSPEVSTSILLQDVDWNVGFDLKTNGDTLLSQTINLTNYYNPTFVFAFIGTGTVTISGSGVPNATTITGIGPNKVTKQTVDRFGASGSVIEIAVSGDVRLAALKKSITEPPLREISRGYWLAAGTQRTNFGTFNEIAVSYRSY